MPPRLLVFLRRYALTIGLCVTAGIVGRALLAPAPADFDASPDGRYVAALVAGNARRRDSLVTDSTRLHRQRDSVTAVRSRVRIQYVTERRTTAALVDSLPAIRARGDTAQYVAQLERTVEAQTIALTTADSVMRADSVVIQTQDHTIDTLRSLAVVNDSTASLEHTRAEGLKEKGGFLSRLKGSLLGSTKLLGAAAVGFVVATVVR